MVETGFACIVGAPRCGTTTLAGFLQNHPDVDFSLVKEPHFFSSHDLTELPEGHLRTIVREEYLRRFFEAGAGRAKMLAEGSVSYLYAPEHMTAIVRHWRSARFIIALRNPVDMLRSLHQRLLYIGDETCRDFCDAWALIPDRKNGRNIPRSCIDPRILFYDEIGRLGHYVDRLFRAVGRERCHIVLFDDLRRDPGAVYGQLLGFLTLTPQAKVDLRPRRESRDFRFGWLQRLLKRPPMVTRSFLAGEKYRRRVQSLASGQETSSLIRSTFAVRRRLLDWNSVPAHDPDLPGWFRASLQEAFAEDIAHLSTLIGRDLTPWLHDRPVPRRSLNSRQGEEVPRDCSIVAASSSGIPRTVSQQARRARA